MALIRINPTKMLVGGDKRAAQNFLGPARSQLEILKNQMSFQNLSQGIRRVWLNDDVYVECRKIFNYQECRVWVRPVVPEEKEFLLPVIISLFSGKKAFAWDLEKNELMLPVDTKAKIFEQIEALDKPIESREFEPLIQLQPDGEWEVDCSETVQSYMDGNLPAAAYGALWSIDVYSDYLENAIVPYNPDLTDWNIQTYIDWWDEHGSEPEGIGAYFKINAYAIYKAVEGDSITFKTERGTNYISILSENLSKPDAKVYSSYFHGDVLGSIDEIWTLHFIKGHFEDFIFIEGHEKKQYYIHITGASVGNVYDSGAGPVSQFLYQESFPGYEHVPYSFYAPLCTIKYIENEDATLKRGGYLFKTSDGFAKEFWKNDFYTLSGYTWPVALPSEEEPNTWIIRERFFYNSVFGPNIYDYPKVYCNGEMKALIFSLYDSFIDGDWGTPGLLTDIYYEDGVQYEIIERTDYAHNRCAGVNSVGHSLTYEPLDDSDTTPIYAHVVFDSYCFNSYVGQCNSFLQTGLNFFYKKTNPLSGFSLEVFDLVNAERVSNGAEPLVFNHILYNAAQRHATDMANNSGLLDSHIGSDGSLWYERFQDAGYYFHLSRVECFSGENVGAISIGLSVTDLVSMWMTSTDHRANILNSNFSETGIAAVISPGTNNYYFCQTFGGKPGIWPGFGAVDTSALNTYLRKVFSNTEICNEAEENQFDFFKVYTTQKKQERP